MAINNNNNPQNKFVPKKVFFTKGIGSHKNSLQSFEIALRNAGISQYNLVTVSSIIPPKCHEVSIEEGLKELLPGQIVFLVLSKAQSNRLGEYLISSMGVAIPEGDTNYGYISELQYYNYNKIEESNIYYNNTLKRNYKVDRKELYLKLHRSVELKSENMALSMLAQSMGINFENENVSSEKENLYFIRKNNITLKSYSIGDLVKNEGEYITAITAAVFIL